MTATVSQLHHNTITLALHHLSGEATSGRPLLLLHGLGERSPETVPDWAASWKGQIYALDFVGHGLSGVPKGGGYSAEVLMADADVALAEIGPSTVVGRGLLSSMGASSRFWGMGGCLRRLSASPRNGNADAAQYFRSIRRIEAGLRGT